MFGAGSVFSLSLKQAPVKCERQNEARGEKDQRQKMKVKVEGGNGRSWVDKQRVKG